MKRTSNLIVAYLLGWLHLVRIVSNAEINTTSCVYCGVSVHAKKEEAENLMKSKH
jgi:hypothetical protein